MEFYLQLDVSLFDFRTLVVQIADCNLVKVFVDVFSDSIGTHSLGNVGLTTISGVVAVGHARDGADNSVIFGKEFTRCEIIKHVSVLNARLLAFFVTTFLISAKLLAHHDTHGFEYTCEVGGVLLEDGVFGENTKLVVDTLGPVGDLVIDDVDSLESLLEQPVVLLRVLELVVHLDDFGVVFAQIGNVYGFRLGGLLLVNVGVDLELVETLGKLFVLLFQLINLGFTGTDSDQEVGVGLLTGQESLDHLLDVGNTGVRLDLLEGIVDFMGVSHLFLHLPSHESVPKSLDQQVLAHGSLGGILVLVGGSFSDLLVSALSLDTSLHGLFLVLDALLELEDSLLSVLLLLLDVLHEAIEN